MRQTPLQQLAEVKLGRPLAGFVTTHLAKGAGWRRISDDLWNATGLRISHESLRSWFTAPQDDAA